MHGSMKLPLLFNLHSERISIMTQIKYNPIRSKYGFYYSQGYYLGILDSYGWLTEDISDDAFESMCYFYHSQHGIH